MGNTICMLIDVFYEGGIITCALKLDREKFDFDPEHHDIEATKRKLAQFLPLHVRSCGPVLRFQEIFEVKELTVA